LDYSEYNLENLDVEVELMNPTIISSTFNVFIKYGSEIPTSTKFSSVGYNWGAGAGMGGMFFNSNEGFNNEKRITLSI
jgi:hypothetical protein